VELLQIIGDIATRTACKFPKISLFYGLQWVPGMIHFYRIEIGGCCRVNPFPFG
jgi:hypothetical protein